MLQILCPNCNETIKSPLLADVSSIDCYECKEKITIKDIYVKTEHFTMHREDLLKRTFRLQKLLREIEKEKSSLETDDTISLITLNNIEQVYLSLKELLEGARNSYRMEITDDIKTIISNKNNNQKGKLLNISTEGASFKFKSLHKVPRVKDIVDIFICLPSEKEPFCIRSKIIWNKLDFMKSGTHSAILGVTFVDLDEMTKNSIWNYILDNAPIPFQ